MRQLATRVLQMGTHKPLELLQLGRVADQDVLSDRIEVVGFSDALAGVFDDPVVDEIQCGQVRLDDVTANGVVIPGAVFTEWRPVCRCGDPPRVAIRSATSSAYPRTSSTWGSIISCTPMKLGPTTFQWTCFEGQMKVVVTCAQLLLQQLGDLDSLLFDSSPGW